MNFAYEPNWSNCQHQTRLRSGQSENHASSWQQGYQHELESLHLCFISNCESQFRLNSKEKFSFMGCNKIRRWKPHFKLNDKAPSLTRASATGAQFQLSMPTNCGWNQIASQNFTVCLLAGDNTTVACGHSMWTILGMHKYIQVPCTIVIVPNWC